jgi:predicted TIM-barrel fold metal-dependent hydrolase
MYSNIIDFHQHLVLPPQEHIEIMDRNGIDKAVVMPLFPSDVKWKEALQQVGINEKSEWYREKVLMGLYEENKKFLETVREYPNLIPAPWITPYDEKRLVKMVNSHDVDIVKFIPVFDCISDYNYLNKIYEMVSKIDARIVMIHTGWGSPVLPWGTFLAGRIDKTVVLAHMKEDTDAYNQERLMVLERYKNIYAETSYCPHPKRIMQYVKKGFGDRLLFGTDFRTEDDEQTVRYYKHLIKETDISENEKRNIFSVNAKKLMEEMLTK